MKNALKTKNLHSSYPKKEYEMHQVDKLAQKPSKTKISAF
jgi:hypothetical protein